MGEQHGVLLLAQSSYFFFQVNAFLHRFVGIAFFNPFVFHHKYLVLPIYIVTFASARYPFGSCYPSFSTIIYHYIFISYFKNKKYDYDDMPFICSELFCVLLAYFDVNIRATHYQRLFLISICWISAIYVVYQQSVLHCAKLISL